MPSAPLRPLRAFNRRPQSAELGSTFRGAYTFPTNVACQKQTEASQPEAFSSLGLQAEVVDNLSFNITTPVHFTRVLISTLISALVLKQHQQSLRRFYFVSCRVQKYIKESRLLRRKTMSCVETKIAPSVQRLNSPPKRRDERGL